VKTYKTHGGSADIYSPVMPPWYPPDRKKVEPSWALKKCFEYYNRE
jgi:hypothetical protein